MRERMRVIGLTIYYNYLNNKKSHGINPLTIMYLFLFAKMWILSFARLKKLSKISKLISVRVAREKLYSQLCKLIPKNNVLKEPTKRGQ